MSSHAQPETITEVLRWHAAERPDRIGFRFLEYPDNGETVVSELSYGRLDAWARAVAVTLGEHTDPGDRVLLLCPPGPEYLAYFFGCLYARLIAVPAYPSANSRHAGRIEAIARDADARLLVVGGPNDVPAAGDARFGLLPKVIATAEVIDGRQDDWADSGGSAQDVAFLQYTSGSTADPKGVMVSHGNLVANSRTAERSFGFSVDSSAVSWLPPYHDMGLIGGIIFPLYTGFPMALMSPLAFLRDPVRWLDAVTRFKATASSGPTFSYDLCCDRVGEDSKDRIDLSSWTCALNGAEPIRADVLDRFAASFERCGFQRSSFYPCYGLAEGTLVVSGAPTQNGPMVRLMSKPALEAGQVRLPESAGTAVALVGSGAVTDGVDVTIVDRDTRYPLPDGQIGEIWARGASVSSGYFGSEEATRQTFGATLATGDGPFLRTGDLGVFVEGELFVTGRASDLMIFQGRNIYPQDIEATSVRSHPMLAATRAAAFPVSVDGEERLVVVQELVRPKVTADELAEITAAVRRGVTEEHGLGIHRLVIVAPRKIPVTSSGKVRRKACRSAYLRDELAEVRPRGKSTVEPAVERPRPAQSARPAVTTDRSADDIESRIRQYIARHADRPAEEIDLSQPFTGYGLGSVHAAGLAADLSEWLGTEVPSTFVWDNQSIEDAVRSLTTGAVPQRTPARSRAGTGFTAEPIAVVGVGCRFPGVPMGAGADGFWDLLVAGGSGIGEMPADRWDVDGLFSPEVGSPGRVYTRHGGFVDGVGSFDEGLFGVSLREAASMDPQQGLVLEVAWEALESAGIAPDSLRGSRTGVFMGVGGSDFERLGAATLDGYAATGSAVNFVANRLSFELGLMGPSLALDTACSSSLVAVHLAVQSLRNDECDMALVGGVNLLLSPDVWIALCGARMLSPNGACNTFDATADGYVRGEGCGVIVLKRQTDITTDDNVLAIIRGTAVNHDGRSNGLTAPNGAAQQDVIRSALRGAAVSPSDVGYVEAHGTGTPLGDPIELRALATVLSEQRPPDRPVLVGSVKTNIGHLEAAAGIAGLIKTILTVHHGQIPPHLNMHQPNPAVTWNELPVRIPTQLTEWPDERRIAGVSAFGFGGTNAHTVIENWPHRPKAPVTAPDTPVVVKVSGSGAAALRAAARRLAEFVAAHRDLSPADVAWTMGVGRADLGERAAIVAETTDELIAGLTAVAELGTAGRRSSAVAPKVVFTVHSKSDVDDVTAAVALGQWWQSVGVDPHVISGSGQGAYAAAALAGVFSTGDGTGLSTAHPDEFTEVLARTRLTPPHTDLVIDGRDGSAAATTDFWLDRQSGTEQGTPDGITIALDKARSYRSLLTELADAWTRGVDVRWDKVNPPRPRVHLPTYPFQRKTFWTPGATSPKATEEPLRPRFVLPATGGAIAETELSLRRMPFLDEHRVYGRIVVPGVVLVELLLQAGERLLGAAPAIEDVMISRPMVLADDELCRVQVVVDPVSGGRATARVFSEDASGEWHVHVRAGLLAAGSVTGPSLGDVSLPALSGGSELDHDGFYAQAWHPSFVLGPSFRLVRAARRGPNAAEGTLVAPGAETAGVLAGVRADLLLLDACVQLVGVAAATGQNGDRHVQLGTGYDRVIVHRPATTGTFHCRAVTRTAADGTATGDLLLTDEDGNPVAELSGVRFRELSAQMLERLMSPGSGVAVVSVPGIDALRSASKEDRVRQVCDYFVRLTAGILRTEPAGIDQRAPLSMFFDSLMLAEFRTAVERDLKVPLALESLFTDSGLESLAELVAGEIGIPEIHDGEIGKAEVGVARPARKQGPAALRTRLQPMTVAEMAQRAELDPAITAHEPPGPSGPAPDGVLLTGSTGFVGAFVLAELLARRSGPVYCLVRAEDEAHAMRRVLENLDRYGVDIAAHRSRVRPVIGDLTKPLLGLDERAFANLHELAGDIVHCGAQVKWTYPYRGLEAANVDGTREILRLATVGAPRTVHYASTVGVFSSREYPSDVVDEAADLAMSGSLVVGYAQSKWVAERMVRTAGERGVPVTIHRINTGGHSTTGAFNRLDHLSMMVKGCVEAGIAPEHVEMPVQPAPVDYVAAAMAEASTRPELRGRTFHLVNPGEMSWPEFFDAVEQYGYRVARLPFDEWRSRIVSSQSGTMALLGLIPFLNDAVEDVRLPHSASAGTQAALGATCPPLDTKLVHTYLDAYVRSGFVDPPTRR